MTAPTGAEPGDTTGTTPPGQPGSADPQHTYALAPLAPAGYPSPAELASTLKQRIDQLFARTREGRTVTQPEDTHAAVRQLADWYVLADNYRDAYAEVQAHLERYAEEELLAAEDAMSRPPKRKQTHPDEPAGQMKVPASGMTITLEPVFEVDRDINLDQVLRALATTVMQQDERLTAAVDGHAEVHAQPGEEIDPAEWHAAADAADQELAAAVMLYAVEVAQQALGLRCKSDPSIKAIRALATLAGARGDDNTAATINSAIQEHGRKYRNRTRIGVKPTAA